MDPEADEPGGDRGDAADPAPRPPLFEAPDPPPIPDTLREHPHATASKESGYSDMSKAWGVAMDFVFTIIGFALLGYFADRWQSTSPKYTLIGLAAGFALALYRIIRRTMSDEKREQERRKSGGSGSR